MNDLLTLLNHLIAVWAEQNQGASDRTPRSFSLSQLRLEDDGFWLTGQIDSAVASGEVTVRGRIESSGGARHKLHLRLERCPERMSDVLEALRGVLESARIDIELDFDTEIHEV